MLETSQQTNSWYLDSGATHHVSGDPSIFSSIHPTSGARVRSVGGQNHSVDGVRNVDIQALPGAIKTIPSVLYTPGITKNLLSVGCLTDQNKTLVFNSEGCYVVDNVTVKLEAFASRENSKGLYILQGDPTLLEPEANTLQLNSQATLWHKRLGHFHTRGMQRMLNSGAVKGMSKIQFSKQTCSGCQLGKQARTKIPKESTYHASKILELVHSDVCGPFKVNSTGGARYFVSFIDDYSRKLWIYFMSHKSQVLAKFQHFVQLVENTTGYSIKTLRTCNGGEYTSHAFHDFCSSKGIIRELTPPHTPQRKGVAERRNRSLLDITRCLLLDKALPGHLWGEAIKAASIILNLRSTKWHPDKTPNKLFSGKKPSITHLRNFGSPAFAHIPKTSRTKLDPRSEKCILLNFDDDAKTYRCYRPSSRKVFISRDIHITEDNSSNVTNGHEHDFIQGNPMFDDTFAPTRTEESPTLPNP